MSRPLQQLQRFFRELKRRNVYRVAATYAVVGFVLIQAADLIFPALNIPSWTYSLVVVLILFGFPIAVVLAWAFERTPEGVQRTPKGEVAEDRPAEAAGGIRAGYKVLVGLGLVAAAVAGGWYLTGGGGEPEFTDRSIGVLPFQSMGGDRGVQLAQGLHDDLLTRLSNVSDLRVVWSSVDRYQGTNKTLPEIARELDVRWLVGGDVQQVGNRIRVNAHLVNAPRDEYRWAENYEETLTTENLFSIQGKLTKRIARSLQAELSPGEQARVERRPTGDLEAYRLYVRGRRLLDRRQLDSIRVGREHFRRALRRDSSYALAWAGLADAHVLYATYAHYASSVHLDSVGALYDALMPAIAEAKDAARRAVELNPDLAEAHTSLGYAHLLSMEGPKALAELKRAVELRPSYSQAHDWLGGLLLAMGQPEAALRHLELAVELNPENQNAPNWRIDALLANGQYETALAAARRQDDRWYEAEALIHLNRWKEVRKAARRVLDRDRDDQLEYPWLEAFLALADVAAGDTASARRRGDELTGRSELASPVPLGLVHAALGERDAAIAVLGRTFEEGTELPPPHLAFISFYKIRYFFPEVLGPLRDDPRFERLIREANRAWGLDPDGSLPEGVNVSFGLSSDG